MRAADHERFGGSTERLDADGVDRIDERPRRAVETGHFLGIDPDDAAVDAAATPLAARALRTCSTICTRTPADTRFVRDVASSR